MTVLAVLVGVALTLWVCTIPALAYVIYRYVWQPWKVVRADIAALDQQHKTFAAEVMAQIETRRARVGVMSDAEVAGIEEQLLADSRRRRADTGVVR